MRLKVIACEVLARELYWCAARSRHAADITLLAQGLHDNSDTLRGLLQERIDAAGTDRYDAVVLGYGLCNNSLLGVSAAHLPVIVPRAHDCITLLLGSKERYARLFARNPGTYWFSSGWLETRDRQAVFEPRQNSGLGPLYKRADRRELAGRYGEDNAKYLAEFMDQWEARYTRGVLIEFPFTAGLGLEADVKRLCRRKGWQFARVRGSVRLLRDALDGRWDAARFLRVAPGRRIRASFDETIMGVEGTARRCRNCAAAKGDA